MKKACLAILISVFCTGNGIAADSPKSLLKETEAFFNRELVQRRMQDPAEFVSLHFQEMTMEQLGSLAISQKEQVSRDEIRRLLDERLERFKMDRRDTNLAKAAKIGVGAGVTVSGVYGVRNFVRLRNAGNFIDILKRHNQLSKLEYPSLAEEQEMRLLSEDFIGRVSENFAAFEYLRKNSEGTFWEKGALQVTTPWGSIPIAVNRTVRSDTIRIAVLRELKAEVSKYAAGQLTALLKYRFPVGESDLSLLDIFQQPPSFPHLALGMRLEDWEDNPALKAYIETITTEVDHIIPDPTDLLAFSRKPVGIFPSDFSARFVNRYREAALDRSRFYPLNWVQNWESVKQALRYRGAARWYMEKFGATAAEKMNRPPSWKYEFDPLHEPGISLAANTSFLGILTTVILTLGIDVVFSKDPTYLDVVDSNLVPWTTDGEAISGMFHDHAMKVVDECVKEKQKNDSRACTQPFPCDCPVPILEGLTPIAENLRGKGNQKPLEVRVRE